MKTKILFFISVITVVHGVTYDCTTNGTVKLWTNEIVFFQTNNYPTLMEADDVSKCILGFALNESVNVANIHPKVYVVFTEITLTQSKRTVIIQETLNFNLYTNFKGEAAAQKGFIIFDDWRTSCPMQSIATINPFTFEDDSQILYLRSTYDQVDFNRSSPCVWKFMAPDGYGFKFLVEVWNASDLSLLTVINRTDILTNEIGLRTYHPYYNPDQWMLINLTKNPAETLRRLEFQAYVTIVKKEFPNIDAKCTASTAEFNTTWTVDRMKGYGKNVNCTHILTIPPKREVLVDIDKVVFEKGVDYIKYYPEAVPRNYTMFDAPTKFILEPGDDGKDKKMIWEFVTDGSVQSSGFEVSFMEMPCVCNDEMIHCDTPDFNIMKSTPDYYCGTLNCNFNISSCPTDMIQMIFEPHDVGEQQDLYDVFTVYSNNEAVLEIDNTNRYLGKFPVYLNSLNYNTFEVIANVSKNVKWLEISVSNFTAPKITHNVTLTAVNSSAIIDTSLNDLVLFKIDEKIKSQSLVIYSTFSHGGLLYNNETLSLKLFGDKCFDRYLSPYKCEIDDTKFIEYTPKKDSNNFPFLAVRLSDSHKGCLFDENIFSTKNASFVSISAIATSEAACDVTLLVDDLSYYFVSHLYTTADKEMVRVFIGMDRTKEYFSFNSSTASTSINAGLFSKVYTINIPKSATFLMYLTRYTFNSFAISKAPYKSVIATPNYATTKMNTIKSDYFASYQIGKVKVKFTAIEYKMGKNDDFYFMAGNQRINITKKGDSKTFTNQRVTLHYIYDQNTDATTGAFFSVETI